MLCDSKKTALRIDSQWSRRQIRQSVRAALIKVSLILFGAVLCCLKILFNNFILIRGECCVFTTSLLSCAVAKRSFTLFGKQLHRCAVCTLHAVHFC